MTFASNQHGTTRDLYMRPVDGGTLTQLTTDPSDDIMPALHPSGKKIAFASNRTGNWDIYVMDIDGGQTTKLTDDVDHELHPSWAPDGKRLVYCKLGSQSGRWEMWSVDTSKPGVHRYFSAWTVDYVNGEAVHRTEIVSAGNAAVINPSWSPDGSRIVFVTVVDPETNLDGDSLDQSDLWIINLDGSGRTNLTDGRYANYQPMWSTDDRVYFVSNRSGVDNIWSVPAARALDSISPRTSRFRSAERGAMEDEFDGRP
jgi:Tol biopolymer transport system component